MTKDSYVHVMNEPQHKTVFQNEYTRIYRAQIKNGWETLYHLHTEDTLYITLETGWIKSIPYGESKILRPHFSRSFSKGQFLLLVLQTLIKRYQKLPQGAAFMLLNRKMPLIHKAVTSPENKRDVIMLGVELFKKKEMGKRVKLNSSKGKKEFSHHNCTVYRIGVKKRAISDKISIPYNSIVIPLSGKAVLKAADGREIPLYKDSPYHWNIPYLAYDITNRGESRFSALVLIFAL